tara:strand:- start:5031 stop:5411 length:381 start_codon:yes stop_codon:yes gene_type:complete
MKPYNERFTRKQIEAHNIIRNLAQINISINEGDLEGLKSYDDLYDYLDEKNLFWVDIIYYHEAMKYLMKNDPSLTESMEIANHSGYQFTNDLNSELLASLHATEKARENFADMKTEIDYSFAMMSK